MSIPREQIEQQSKQSNRADGYFTRSQTPSGEKKGKNMEDWRIYKGTGEQNRKGIKLPDPPPWRRFSKQEKEERGKRFKPNNDHEIEMVNAALYLRRPLLVTGKPGTGKTSLAYSVAYELNLGDVLRWSVTTRSVLQEGLYRYDAIARLQDASLREKAGIAKKTPGIPKKKKKADDCKDDSPDISRYLRLGPLGTAFASKEHPRVLLIDEIDKSDIDLPNDLLHIFEEGVFEIPELARLPDEEKYRSIPVLPCDDGESVTIERGKVECEVFPMVIMTSNGEREFPPAFLRRCLRLNMEFPIDRELAKKQLVRIVRAHLGDESEKKAEKLITEFLSTRESKELATDQLLNAVYLVMKGIDPLDREEEEHNRDLLDALWESLQ
ncbi:MoxR family ATPase [Desulfococcaceae bacterium HSG8]|nr:MoxR family ATPase [Desulfococcaceae bacterium HSG8]